MGVIKCAKCKWFVKIRKHYTKRLPKIIFACEWLDIWYIKAEDSKELSESKKCNFVMSEKYLKYKKER
jgi:hypothetical protein